MKNQLIVTISFCFLLFSQSLFAQKYFNILEAPRDLPFIDGKVTYQGILEIEGASMADLYGFAKKFIAETYTSTDAAIDMDDTLNGVIVVKGRSDVPLTWYEKNGGKVEQAYDKASVKHLLIFEIKNGRLRYTIKDLVAEKSITYYTLYSSHSADYSTAIETHFTHRKNFDQIEDPNKKEMASANYSGAFLVGSHKYFTDFSARFEPYFKKQKAEDW
jgi:hypothetical protein